MRNTCNKQKSGCCFGIRINLNMMYRPISISFFASTLIVLDSTLILLLKQLPWLRVAFCVFCDPTPHSQLLPQPPESRSPFSCRLLDPFCLLALQTLESGSLSIINTCRILIVRNSCKTSGVQVLQQLTVSPLLFPYCFGTPSGSNIQTKVFEL